MPVISLQPDQVTRALTAPLAVVIPVYNEVQSIRDVVAEWATLFAQLSISYQFILVNDGSRDDTLRVMEAMEREDPGHLIVVDKPNAGHGRTCRLGYTAAVASSSVEWVLQIDSDGQCDPSYFREFWEKKETADCVFGKRIHRDDGIARTLTSKICRIGAMLIGGHDLIDPNVPYRLIKKDVLAVALDKIPASFDIHNVAVTLMLKRNRSLRWEYVPIRFRERQGGSNSINLLNVAHLGVSMLFDLAKLRK